VCVRVSGCIQGPDDEPVALQHLPHRRCMMYRVRDSSSWGLGEGGEERAGAGGKRDSGLVGGGESVGRVCEGGMGSCLFQGMGGEGREGAEGGGGVGGRLRRAALLCGVGPVGLRNLHGWAHWNERALLPIIVNRLCFAESEDMDLLFLLAVHRHVPGRNGYFVKLPALRLALAEYHSVAWIDMDGFAPFMPRPESRKCVPFTECWPPDAQVVISMSPVPPRFPITSLFILFRGNLTDALIDLAWVPKDSTGKKS